MAVSTLSSLLSSLTEAVESASDTLCEPEQIIPPSAGVSLLDTKNELFLSYLQNLVFLIILKLRHLKDTSSKDGDNEKEQMQYNDEIVKKLVELRVYLEKGVRPLESRLRYQIDKTVRAADDAALRQAAQKLSINGKRKKSKGTKTAAHSDSEVSNSEQGDSDGDVSTGGVDLTAYRPDPKAFMREEAQDDPVERDDVYRPPKITPTSMPTTESRKEHAARMPKSNALDEYIETEMSTAPTAQPSVGSTIAQGGRRNKSVTERREEQERKAYEETNFVRLPTAGKKEKRQQDRKKSSGWGGEEWAGLGAGADRVSGLVASKKKGGGGALEKSRKRANIDLTDGGGGREAGAAFAKKRKMTERRRH